MKTATNPDLEKETDSLLKPLSLLTPPLLPESEVLLHQLRYDLHCTPASNHDVDHRRSVVFFDDILSQFRINPADSTQCLEKT